MATRRPKSDKPISFGYKCAWYALRTNDVAAVVVALGLEKAAESSWATGIEGAYRDKVFVTPPLGAWILAAGWSLFYEGESPQSVQPRLVKLSQQFTEAQYFCTYRVPEAHCWARARSGKLARAFGYLGERGEITWNRGKPTKPEIALGSAVFDFPGPDECDVMKIAGAWSIDPSSLEANFTEPGLGRVGLLS